MARVEPLKFLSTGIGGYAWSIAQHLLTADAAAEPVIRLLAMCDPAPEKFPDRVALLESRGVRTYRSFEEMIEQENAEAVWLPIPIHLHRPFAEKALARGLHVVTEKPAAGCLQDVDAMIAARDAAKRDVLVGFQDIYASQTMPAKRALLDGAIGKITHGTVHASWPRDLKYYSRNQWAGALRVKETWVLDSPLQNAISHYVNLALFLMGDAPATSAAPTRVEAELYRVNKIENYDTCALKITLTAGSTLTVFLTHASSDLVEPVVSLYGTHGRLLADNNRYVLTGEPPNVWEPDGRKHQHMVETICSHFRGEPHAGAVATLDIARIHTMITNAASEAAPITVVGGDDALELTQDRPAGMCAIRDVAKVMDRCIAQRKLPSQLGDVRWARPGGAMDLAGYQIFKGPRA
ncbi:MAG: Gfo/Idh/MocA family oxidoreductase [Burkholderiales bacterium]|nr:Gfo/Idh/MocA family oxidoreductase [Phycisphaerae bacterium]